MRHVSCSRPPQEASRTKLALLSKFCSKFYRLRSLPSASSDISVCRAVPVLRRLAFVSPNAAECVAMAAAVRRRRRGGVAGPEAASRVDALVQSTQGAAAGPRSAREVVSRLLPSVQTLLEVSDRCTCSGVAAADSRFFVSPLRD